MLESLRVKNFQTHRKLRVEFDPLITTFVGPSDQGKSAILRALYWLCLNQPAGDEFLSWGENQVQVTLKVDGHSIKRVKGKGENYYQLNGDNAFKALGQGTVPVPIAFILNVDTIHFQQQHDSPLWFSESAGEVSRQLNQIVDLGIIDDLLSASASAVRSARSEVVHTEQRLQEASEALTSLEWVPLISADWASLEGLERDSQKTAQDCITLRRMIEDGTRAIQGVQNAVESKRDAFPAIQAGQEALEIRQQAERLRELLGELESGEQELCQVRSAIQTSQAVLDRETQGQQCPLCQQLLPTASK